MDKWGKLNLDEWNEDEDQEIEEENEEENESRNDDDEFREDEYEFRDEAKAFERAGFADEELGTSFEGMNEKMRKIDRFSLDHYQKFSKRVQAASLDIINRYDQRYFGNQDLNYIKSKIKNVKRPDYKNALGFVLGFIASDGGRQITKTSVDKAFLILENISDNRVTQPDVIRYARYWLTL